MRFRRITPRRPSLRASRVPRSSSSIDELIGGSFTVPPEQRFLVAPLDARPRASLKPATRTVHRVQTTPGSDRPTFNLSFDPAFDCVALGPIKSNHIRNRSSHAGATPEGFSVRWIPGRLLVGDKRALRRTVSAKLAEQKYASLNTGRIRLTWLFRPPSEAGRQPRIHGRAKTNELKCAGDKAADEKRCGHGKRSRNEERRTGRTSTGRVFFNGIVVQTLSAASFSRPAQAGTPPDAAARGVSGNSLFVGAL